MARSLIVEIIGDSSSLEGALGRSAAASTGFVGRMESASAKMASVGASMTRHLTLPIVAIGAAGTKMAMDFQSSMELLHTQAGVSQQAVESLSKSVLGMAGSVATTPETLSTGLFHLASQGLRGKQALDALRIAAEGAKVGQANLEDVTNALGAAIVSGIKGSDNYTQAMGQLNAIVGAGDMHMQDLADAMGTGLPAKAAVAGVSLRDVGAALAVFGDNNIRGAAAGTLLNSTLRLMEGPSHAAQKAMSKFGISAKDLGETLSKQGLVPAISMLSDKLKGLDNAQKMAALTPMFGGKQAGGVLILIDQLERLKTKQKEVADGGSTFASSWAAYTQTAAYKMDQLGASMSAAGISIGDILLPYVSKAVNVLSGLAQKFQALPGPVKDMIVGIAATVAVVGPVISTVGKLGQVLALLAANPIVLVIAGVALLAAAMAAAVLAPQKLESALEKMGLSASASAKVVAALQDAFRVVQQAAGVLVNAIRDNWGTIEGIIRGLEGIVSGVVSVVKAVWSEFGSNIVQQARLYWNLIKSTIQNDLQVIRGIIDVFSGILHGNWSQVWNGVKEIVSGVWHQIEAIFHYEVGTLGNLADAIGKVLLAGIEAGVSLVIDLFVKLPRAILSALGNLGSLLVGAGQALMEGLAHGIENAASDVLSKVEHVGSRIVSAAKSILHIGSPSRDFIEIGQFLMQGLSVGVDQGSPGAVKSLKQALANAQSAIDGSRAMIELASRRLGEGAVQSIVGGVVGVQQTAAQQIKTALLQAMQQAQQAVAQASQNLASSFASLANSALAAFDQKNANFVSPAQKLLDKMQLQDQVKQYQAAIDQAAAAIKADMDALAKAQAGGDPGALQSAQAQLASDQQAFDAATRQQQEFNIQQLAAKEDKAHAATVAKQRDALAKQLFEIQKGLAKQPAEWDTAQKKVLKLLGSYEVPLYQSGQRFASKFADGLRSQIKAVEKAAHDMAEAVSKYVPRSPAKTGPLAFSSQQMGAKFGSEFATGIAQGLYAGQGLASVAGSFSSLGVGLRSQTGFGAVGAAGGTTVNVTVPVQGSLIGTSPQEVANELKFPIRDALLTITHSEPSIFHGRA